jgi:hypothetical protein
MRTKGIITFFEAIVLDELIGITMGEGAVSIAIYTASY